MEFGLLGPLEVLRDGRPVEVAGARQRALLAVLLLRARQVVPADRLLEDVWGDDQPAAGATALRVRLSQLRKALAPDGELIVTRAPGYLADVGPAQLDLHRFERFARDGDHALARGEAAVAADALGEALALWRGPALADFAYEPFAQGPIRRLEELRMAAREQLVAAQLALGRHAHVLGELEALVAEHPLRERLWAHLMLALYRSGRQADALDAYRRARRVLSEEVGLEPAAELQALERRILHQDPGLDGEVPVARPARSVLAIARADASMARLAAVGVTLARDAEAELIISAVVADEAALGDVTRRLQALRRGAGGQVRVAAFTSSEPGADAARLAAEHDVALLLLDAPAVEGERFGEPRSTVLSAVAADVAIVAGAERDGHGASAPVVVPFAGADHDWAALEAGAWLARGRGSSLRLVGTRAIPAADRRDASRLLASASLALQRGAGVESDYVLADPGADGVLAAGADAGFLVAGLSSRWRQEGLGAARIALARGARCPVLFLRRGVAPSGLAPPEAVTHYTWTRAGS